MATLEKIRSKQKLLFGIVLGALVLFIISIIDAGSIRNFFGAGPNPTVAQVGGVKVDHDTYRRAQEEMSRQNQNQRQDNDVLNQQIIQDLLTKALLDEQFEKLGIKVTDSEITAAMTGASAFPQISQTIGYLAQFFNIPEPNGATVLAAIQNPALYNRTPEELDMLARQGFGQPNMLAVWKLLEDNAEQIIKNQVFGTLYSGLFTANKLDAKTLYDHNTNVANVSYVTSPYSQLKDANIEITDADLKAKYNELKPMFKVAEGTREVDYIVVNIVPSKADLAAAEAEVKKAAEMLRTDSNAVLASNFNPTNEKVPMSQIKNNRAYAGIPDSIMKKGGVYEFPMANNVFRIVRINEIKNRTDSINYALYQAETAVAADSMLAKIKAGEVTFKKLVAENSDVAADSVWTNLVNNSNEILESLAKADINQPYVYNDSVRNIHVILNLNKRNASKDYVDLTTYTYVVDPSANTSNDIRTALSSFLASNSTADRFAANADSLYQLRTALINNTTPSLGVAGTRHPIKWAMNAKKGAVSPIFDDNNGQYYVVVAVKDVYDEEYVPYNSPQIQDQLRSLVLADKKGQILVDKYAGKGKNLDDYAKLMNTDIVTDSTVVFTAPALGALGAGQYRLQAQIAAAQPGKLVGPVAGNNEVMVFVVNNVDKNERPFDLNQDGQAFMRSFGIKDNFKFLAGNRKVKNNLLNIENYDNK